MNSRRNVVRRYEEISCTKQHNIFGIPTCWWFDEGIQVLTNANNFNTYRMVAAVYDTLRDAENYLAIKGCVQSRKVIKIYK